MGKKTNKISLPLAPPDLIDSRRTKLETVLLKLSPEPSAKFLLQNIAGDDVSGRKITAGSGGPRRHFLPLALEGKSPALGSEKAR